MKLSDKALKAYIAIDSALMKCANASVSAYNWTTGGTKSDLACDLKALGSIGVASSFFISSLAYGIIMAPPYLALIHFAQKADKNMEQWEVSAANKGLGDIGVETYKKAAEFSGLTSIGVGGLDFLDIPATNKTMDHKSL